MTSPQTQGKIERWHQTLKNRILLENYIGPHRPQHEMQFQAEDPSIIYRVADAPSRPLRIGVLPLGIGPSTKGR